MQKPFITKRCLLIWLLALPLLVVGQNRQFRHLTSADGLSQSEVYSFLEDGRGFMWFGTVDGLNRYDGYEVSVFRTDKDDPNSISHNTVRCLAEDTYGRIWIGTDDGLSVYNTTTEKIHQVKFSGMAPARLTINAAVVERGVLYLATSSGLLLTNIHEAVIDHERQAVRHVPLPGGEEDVTACLPAKDGTIWVTTRNGLFRLRRSPLGGELELTRELNLLNTLNSIRNLTEDDFGNLWIVSYDSGFLRYSPTTGRRRYFTDASFQSNVFTRKTSSVAIDKAGNLWVGTHDQGLLFLEKDSLNAEAPFFQRIIHDANNDRSLNSNLVYSLYVTKNNLLWIGTIGSGINIYDSGRKPFQYYNLRSATNQVASGSNFIRAVYADADDRLWIGSHGNGLFLFDRKERSQCEKIGFGTESVFHVNDAGDGNTLVCTERGVSLVRFGVDGLRTLSSVAFGPSFFVTSPVNGICWVATLHGLKRCRLDAEQITLEGEYNTGSQPAISLNNCRVLLLDETSNELFVGTEGGGLNVVQLSEADGLPLNNTAYRKSDTPGAISNNYVRSIVKGSDGSIWVGTYEGLNQLHQGPGNAERTFHSYAVEDGLPNNTIQSIVEDQSHDLWIGTNQGLCKFRPDAQTFTQYSANDGIQSKEFSEHAAFKTRRGEIIMGGINGINTFCPDEITADELRTNITLTDFYLFNRRVAVGERDADEGNVPLQQSITLTDSIALQPGQNSFGFDFSAMVFNAPEKVRYAYKLVGFEEEWSLTDASNRRANYTNLDYGDYTFMVRAANNDGVWEEAPRSLYLSIKTPFYLSKVAYILYALLSILAIVFFTNYSILRHTTKNKLLLENLHNKKVRELEELRTRFFVNVSHDLRTPLTLISSPLSVILEHKQLPPDVSKLLSVMARNVDKLKAMTEQLLDHRKMASKQITPQRQWLDLVGFVENEVEFFTELYQRKGITLEVRSESEQAFTDFDPDMISKVIFNLLSNALKHTASGKVLVTVSATNDQDSGAGETSEPFLVLRVQDTGSGIAQANLTQIFERFYQGREQLEKGYGIGLSHVKELIEAHGGSIEVSSKKGEGSTFSVYLPKTENAALAIAASVGQSDLPAKAAFRAAESGRIDSDGSDRTTAETATILLVEDNPELRQFVAEELRKQYRLLEATNGAEGLELAKAHQPDLVISDIMMPVMDGLELCQALKSDINTSHLPVILLTAKADMESRYAGLETGADAYLAKPFEMKHLQLKIRNLLAQRDRLRELFQADFSLNPAKVTVTSIDEQFLKDLLAEIEKGMGDYNFSISTLEQKMGMSHASFYTKIKSLTGQSAKELLFSMRMKRARQILEDTANIRVGEVADMVGFADPKYFSKRFREYFNLSPSSLRKS